ncbi:GntG family PLP-dependent aldolase [Actinomadura macra]|uniref:GntG family PLP-dependent aldolase n=1 Tax=Actinomadura macra TaxID=46164 RepID=UPI000834399F|nr:GntG family PLP-dependent aldolase [Actinomadura macra]
MFRVELRSDTFTLPTAEMLDAMTTAELGDDVYGEDPTVNALERRAAQMVGKEAACFMPSGTMSNLASIMAHCPRGSQVIVGAESDIYVYQAGGASVCGGIVYHPVANRRDGTMDLEEIEAAFPDDPDDPQFALPALICLENPQNHCGGRVLPLGHLKAIRALATQRGVPVHLDGARIFNAALACGVAAPELASYADSIQFCLSKGLAAPAGSVVAGSRPFVAEVRRIRKMLGGGMRQAGVLAAAGLVALETMVGRLAEDHANAVRLAEGLADLDGVRLDPRPVEMNMVFFRPPDAAAFVARCGEMGVGVAELGRGRIRCVTHAGISAEDVDHALTVFAKALSEPASNPS